MGSPTISDREAGSASVLVLAFAGVLLLLALVMATAGAMVTAHRRAQAAADLTALSAAAHGCGAAPSVAARNGAKLIACEAGERSAQVTVEVEGPRWLDRTYTFQAQGRAGPALPASL